MSYTRYLQKRILIKKIKKLAAIAYYQFNGSNFFITGCDFSFCEDVGLNCSICLCPTELCDGEDESNSLRDRIKDSGYDYIYESDPLLVAEMIRALQFMAQFGCYYDGFIREVD